MPSSYTADIYNGKPVTLDAFVLRCARAMGALVMRDEPLDAPLPDKIQPDTYTSAALKEAEAEYQRVFAMSDAELQAELDTWYEQRVVEVAALNQRDQEIAGRYRAMLDQVRAWKPPTPDHQGLKDFMVEQLTESLRFDTCERYPSERPTVDGTRRATAELLVQRRVAHSEEVERVRQRNEWLDALRNSLQGNNPEASEASKGSTP